MVQQIADGMNAKPRKGGFLIRSQAGEVFGEEVVGLHRLIIRNMEVSCSKVANFVIEEISSDGHIIRICPHFSSQNVIFWRKSSGWELATFLTSQIKPFRNLS